MFLDTIRDSVQSDTVEEYWKLFDMFNEVEISGLLLITALLEDEDEAPTGTTEFENLLVSFVYGIV
jgi:hypothetical protein